MTFTQTLQLKERFFKFEDLRALDYCEKRWQEEGRPTERWQLINFLEQMLHELKEQADTPRFFYSEKSRFSGASLQSSNPARLL